MNASKEMACKADDHLERAALLLDKAVCNSVQRNEIKRQLLHVRRFIEAAERNLPTEAACEQAAK